MTLIILLLCPSWSQITKFAHAPESLNPISVSGIHKMSENYIGEQGWREW